MRPSTETHVLIHGGCPGPDLWAADFARDHGWKIIECPADWDQYGKAAGPIRNQHMVDLWPDLVLAFWDGKSKGTWDSIRRAIKKGIEVWIISGERVLRMDRTEVGASNELEPLA